MSAADGIGGPEGSVSPPGEPTDSKPVGVTASAGVSSDDAAAGSVSKGTGFLKSEATSPVRRLHLNESQRCVLTGYRDRL